MAKRERFENMDFSDEPMEEISLKRREYIDCDFRDVDFSEMDKIEDCIFENCNFSSASLNGLDIVNSSFLNCNFRFTNLFATTFQMCKTTGSLFFEADCSVMTIIGGDWSYTQLQHVEFDKKTIEDVSFRGADLTGAAFTRCVIKACDFSEAITREVRIIDSDLRESRTEYMDILSLKLKNTKLDLAQCIQIAEATGGKYVD
jgi:hypothetical protein